MKIFEDNLSFVQDLQDRFPQKDILGNFKMFLETSAEERPVLAQQKLDTLPRAGYVERGIERAKAQTVGEHIRAMKEMTKEITGGFPMKRLNKIIEVHDMAEAIIGDLMPSEKISKDEKNLLEKIAINVIYETDPDRVTAWEEYEYGRSLNGKIAKDIDKLEMWDQAEIYKTDYNELNFDDLIKSVKDRSPASFSSINTVCLFNARKKKYAP